MEKLGKLLLTFFAILAIYNLYTLLSSGVVLHMRRWDSDVWIAYTDNPNAFLLWAAFYVIAAVIAALTAFGRVLGFWAWKRRARQAALHQFAEGSSRPPVVRSWKDP
jgi:hypothetical protein